MKDMYKKPQSDVLNTDIHETPMPPPAFGVPLRRRGMILVGCRVMLGNGA
jgi:hypothetical protein